MLRAQRTRSSSGTSSHCSPRTDGARTSRRSQRAYRAMPTRSKASTSWTTFQPSSTVPSTSESVTQTSLRKTSLRWCGPIMQSIGAHLDPWARHRHEENREALVLLLMSGRACQQEAPLRHGGVGRPDLLTVHEPPIAVAARGRLHGREIGSGVGLAEALAPDHVAPRDGGQVLLLLLRCAMAHDRGPHPVDAHILRAAGLVVRPHLFAHRGLLPDRRALARPILRARRCRAAHARRGSCRSAGRRRGRRDRQ